MNITDQISFLQKLLPTLMWWLGSAGLLAVLVLIVRRAYGYRRLLRQTMVHLELTPPAQTDRVPVATKQLFIALYGLGMSRRWPERLLGYHSVFAMEIVSTRAEGIRFILSVPEEKAATLEKNIAAYMPDIRFRQINDYLVPTMTEKGRIVSYKQKSHFALPLQDYEELIDHDPIGYITNAMTQLSDDELVAVQVVIQPVRLREAEILSHKILHNEDTLAKLGHKRSPLPFVLHAIRTILFGLTDAIGHAYHGPSQSSYNSVSRQQEYQVQVAKHIKPARTLSFFEQEVVESIHHKLAQPLFKTELRVLLACETKQEIRQRKSSIDAALGLFDVPKYQGLKANRHLSGLSKKYQRAVFTNRLPAVFSSSNILAASELSGLYHFPHSVMAKTENVVKSLSKTLPAPVSLKNGSKLDVLFGENHHHGAVTAIGLTAAERERHAYIIGGTGNGKTTMLQYAIVQDIQNGKGVAVIDPHGDLAETILRHIPKDRQEDVIYFRPYDIDHPVGLNLLELPTGLSNSELLLEQDFVTEAIVSVFRKTFSNDDSGGHRIEYILRNAIRTAFTVKDATLFTLLDLLTDSTFRKNVTDKLEDKRLKNFWKEEFGKAGAMQRVKLGYGVTTKLGRFDGSEQVKRVMDQPTSTINFDDIINSGKILICNFAKGELGEDTSELFGISVLAKLQLAALRRARQPEASRRPFYLYVDEFQNFATMSFVQLLSEARKYKLFLTMAEQSTSQQDEQQLVDIILANVGTVVCFRSGSPADERFTLPLFKPYLEEGEIANLSSFNFYMRIAAVQVNEPLSGQTVLLSSDGSATVAEEVRQLSRSRYANEHKEKEEMVQKPKLDPAKDNEKERENKQLLTAMKNAVKPSVQS